MTFRGPIEDGPNRPFPLAEPATPKVRASHAPRKRARPSPGGRARYHGPRAAAPPDEVRRSGGLPESGRCPGTARGAGDGPATAAPPSGPAEKTCTPSSLARWSVRLSCAPSRRFQYSNSRRIGVRVVMGSAALATCALRPGSTEAHAIVARRRSQRRARTGCGRVAAAS